MSSPKKVSALARLNEITTTPHPAAVAQPAPNEGIVRYTAEIPKHLHRSLKLFAMDNDTSTYAVTKALLSLLAEDGETQDRVRGVLSRE
jgi:hypothetical protein